MGDIKTSFHKLDRARANLKYQQQKNQRKFFKLLAKSNNQNSSDDDEGENTEINNDLDLKKLKITYSNATTFDPI